MWLIYRIYYSHNFYNILLEVYLFMVQIFLSMRYCALHCVCNGKYSRHGRCLLGLFDLV